MCGHTENLLDYAFDELPAGERPAMEQHLAECGECSLELDRLRLTAAALRILPDREIPQRIAFVSDKVFAPSWASRLWNSAARLGFASACVLAAALVIFAYRRPSVQTAAVAAPVSFNQDVSRQVNEAVAKAVAQVRIEDAKMTRAALAEHDAEHDKQYRAQLVDMEESLTVLQKHLNSYTMLASSEMPRSGAGQ